ncbi:response regulator transcription factor [Sphingobacterium alkalisoli]|uniref:Response regulator transcription factor n=1 Tax=Sphingobacterium alkalisoli TaxID=1874115 RepID=A0A4V5LXZ9_9SPHI|nr:response regulator transcription factor [Sphingobacterium alkalisoli]TJY64589.1 response regulator transcription factor [Sphingobacterium alkalisoli]GGH20807.1 DNA-binding response regulator [Sphingobacterium alkalisoli]
MQILVVEDDKRISDFLIRGLEEHAYSVTLCSNAEDATAYYLNLPWDLIIVDVMLPGIDGIQLVQIIRHKKINVPILMLSALSAVQDKITALDYGADDYITKPFHFEELLSRIRALTRRYQSDVQETSNQAYFGNLHIDFDQFQVSVSALPIELSPREFKLLVYLTENINKAVSRMQILNAVWGINFDNQTNVVDVYISYLRNKIEKNGDKFIHTVKGIGYLFKI